MRDAMSGLEKPQKTGILAIGASPMGVRFVKWIRRVLLELWVVLPIAVIVGFLGPFGTYLSGDFLIRAGRWWAILMGAYVVMRPTMELWRALARATALPYGSLVFWGMVLSSFPMTLLWRLVGREEVRLLGGYSGLLPFTLLCSLLIMLVAWWAERADDHLLRYYDGSLSGKSAVGNWLGSGSRANGTFISDSRDTDQSSPGTWSAKPRLYARLSAQFAGEILALESEDHYVRVHGMQHSELLLLRLRDAIAEMDESLGEQTHRSWWVARNAVAEVAGSGRNRYLRLVNGTRALVARDSVERLSRSGFLPN